MDVIKKSSNSLLHIINDIIDSSKIESGAYKINKEENIDIMIDDSPSTCKKMQANKIRAIYFRGIRGPKIAEDKYLKEVNNWGQIYRILKEV